MVQPFASLVAFPADGVPRLLVNRERRGQELGLDFDSPGSADGLFLGDCDAGAMGLAARLGWELTAASTATSTATSGSDGVPAGDVDACPPRVRLGLARRSTSKVHT